MAYIYDINPTTTNEDGSGENQTSPSWVLTVLRYKNQNDTSKKLGSSSINKKQGDSETLEPIIVTSDCLSLTTSTSKASHTPAMSATLNNTNYNYLAAIIPGDLVFVNILNSNNEADDVADRARKGQPINRVEDGFKGMFKIQSVRLSISDDPASGAKSTNVQIAGYANTELNNIIYFIPQAVDGLFTPASNVASSGNSGNDATQVSEFYKGFGINWNKLVTGPILSRNTQFFIKSLARSLIGGGFRTTFVESLSSSPNTIYALPKNAGNLLGVTSAKTMSAIYLMQLGIQQYGKARQGISSIFQGMNPDYSDKLSEKQSVFQSQRPCTGFAYPTPEFFSQVPVWSILKRFENGPINELYATYKLAPNKNAILPTIVFRQTPFSSDNYRGESTKFLSLPRWKVHPAMVQSLNIGRDDLLRVNFVQVFTRINPGWVNANYQKTLISDQTKNGKNMRVDSADIKRNGLKPVIINSNFDAPDPKSTDSSNSGLTTAMGEHWVNLLGDAMIGGELKLSGQISCMGIVDPITVGDNLEFDGIVYHIESVAHSCSQAPSGEKTFRTNITLSYGVDKNGFFSKMDNLDSGTEQNKDFQNEKILPGITSDANQTPADQNTDPNRTSLYDKAFTSKAINDRFKS